MPRPKIEIQHNPPNAAQHDLGVKITSDISAVIIRNLDTMLEAISPTEALEIIFSVLVFQGLKLEHEFNCPPGTFARMIEIAMEYMESKNR